MECAYGVRCRVLLQRCPADHAPQMVVFSFEDALLATGRSPALTGVLDHFLHNLWWKQAKPKCDCRSVVQSV